MMFKELNWENTTDLINDAVGAGVQTEYLQDSHYKIHKVTVKFDKGENVFDLDINLCSIVTNAKNIGEVYDKIHTTLS